MTKHITVVFVIPYCPVQSTHCANDSLSAEHVLHLFQQFSLLTVQRRQRHASFLSVTPPLTNIHRQHTL